MSLVPLTHEGHRGITCTAAIVAVVVSQGQDNLMEPIPLVLNAGFSF